MQLAGCTGRHDCASILVVTAHGVVESSNTTRKYSQPGTDPACIGFQRFIHQAGHCAFVDASKRVKSV